MQDNSVRLDRLRTRAIRTGDISQSRRVALARANACYCLEWYVRSLAWFSRRRRFLYNGDVSIRCARDGIDARVESCP